MKYNCAQTGLLRSREKMPTCVRSALKYTRNHIVTSVRVLLSDMDRKRFGLQTGGSDVHKYKILEASTGVLTISKYRISGDFCFSKLIFGPIFLDKTYKPIVRISRRKKRCVLLISDFGRKRTKKTYLRCTIVLA